MRRTHALVVAAVVSLLLAACGGGSSVPSPGGTTTPPGGGTTTANPCTTALLADTTEAASIAGPASTGKTPADKKTLIDGDPRGRVYEAMALHRDAENKRAAKARAAAVTDAGYGQAITTPAPVADDVGEIAVIQDTGDLILPLNPYDVRSTGLRFTRNGGSYTLSKIDGTFRSALGTRVTLGDDDSAQVTIPFAFPFYGTAQTAGFVNSDGNITLGEGDNTSVDRNLARMLTGPPRISLFFADLDPTTGTGKIFVNAASDQYTVTWCNVRGFASAQTVTAQATLLPDGSVELKYSDSINIGDSIVGISPGHTGDVTLVDFTTGNGSGSGAIAERFAQATSLDTFAVAKKFYATHPDNYDQILLWTDQRLITDAFSYELTLANEVKGIGQDIYDLSSSVGSASLQSLVVMDFLGKFPPDPTQKFLGENNTLSVMGQECGHRWLAYVDFRDHTGATSEALLGRDNAHWSFFFNSDASVMEGNAIQDQGGGKFLTTDAVKRYSRLDQYLMGLVPPSLVPSFFYVESPDSTHTRADAPQIGVSFTGTRRDVLVEDVIAVNNGPRIPASADSSKIHRQAFIYIVTNGHPLDMAQVAKLDNIRTQWEAFFLQATEGRMTANTRLR
jgi:predicted small secreted protein